LVALGAHIGQELAASGAVGEIELDALEPAIWLLAGEAFLLQRDHMRVIHLDPAERLRQGAEIENGVDAFGEGLIDEIVDDDRADHHRPRAHEGFRHGRQNVLVVIAGELCRQRIAEKGVGPFILGSAEASHHEGRVGNVLDHLRHGAPIAHALASAA
jgi:hypothetical protein